MLSSTCPSIGGVPSSKFAKMTTVSMGSHDFHAPVMYSVPGSKVSPSHNLAAALPTQGLSTAHDMATERRTQTSLAEEQTKSDALHVAPEPKRFSLVFVYGTLKRGFGNHWLIEEQLASKHCCLVGTAHTKFKYPLVCGPFQVPFLLNLLGSGEYVRGELYQVDSHCLERLDELEGTSKGHYVRGSVTVTGIECNPAVDGSLKDGQMDLWVRPQQQQFSRNGMTKLEDTEAEAYFAAMPFTEGLSLAPHIEAYTERESATYVKRKDRPPGRTFVKHVHEWIAEQQKLRSQVTM